jgi:hypothetical protein
MKVTIRLFISVVLLVIQCSLQAQNPQGYPRFRERITMAKFREIGKSLHLDQNTMERLRPIYIRYEKEMADVSSLGIGQVMRVNPDSLTAAEAENIILLQLKNAKKIIFLREKYYTEFKTVLTPQQIVNLYQTEAAIRRRVLQEVRKRFGDRPGTRTD